MKKTRRDAVIEGMAIWGSYYRENMDKFVTEYLQLDFLKWFQLALIAMMNRSRVFVLIASRGLGKTYLIAIFSCARCILYPGTKVVITSGKRSQSIAVLEKISTELIPASPTLCNEIDLKESKFGGADAMVVFKNSSFIKVVTASDNARSNRANLLVGDEFRMISKEIIDTVLKKFLTSRRMPPYRELTPDERKAEYAKEPNMSCFLSSAFFKDHWSYNKMIDTFKLMLSSSKGDFVCGLPYQLSIQEGLLFPEDVESDMLEEDFSEIKWKMEMEALWFGDEGGTFFDFGTVAKNRRLQYPMLPDKLVNLLGGDKRFRIPPKLPGEIRIISLDVALMASKKKNGKSTGNNDAAALFVNQLLPTKVGRYSSNIVYCDSDEGLLTDELALKTRRLFDEFQGDYLVVDAQGVGAGVYDAWMRDMTDPETGEIYPAISCCNNPAMADRCTVPGADKVIWSIKGYEKLNSDCAIFLREAFQSGRMRLLASEYDGEALLADVKHYESLNPAEKLLLQMPYIHTTLLINELVKLEHDGTGNQIRVYEKRSARKDRYSSLSYNYYVATQLEGKLRKRRATDVNVSDAFAIRAPAGLRKKERRVVGAC